MDFAYRPDDWTALFAAVTGASAALTGLLFVGLSINVSAVVDDPEHAARARESLGGTVILLVLSLIVLIPRQGRVALGWELIALFVVLVVLAAWLQSRTLRRLPRPRRWGWIRRTSIFNFGSLSILLAGIGLVTNALGGILWLVVTVIIYFVWSALNAWTIVTRAARRDPG